MPNGFRSGGQAHISMGTTSAIGAKPSSEGDLVAIELQAEVQTRSSDLERNQPQQDQASDPLAPPPAKPSGLIEGFGHLSTLTYLSAPDYPHRLEVDFAAGRARTWLGVGSEVDLQRIIQYRLGGRVFHLANQSDASLVLADGDLRAVTLGMELRRALLEWPGGLDWKIEGDVAKAAFAPMPGQTDLGHVEIQLEPLDSKREPATRQPLWIHTFDSQGLSFQSFQVLSWQKLHGRLWPRELKFFAATPDGLQAIWTEVIQQASTRTYVDRFFTPPDRRDRSHARLDSSVQEIDLATTTWRRMDFPHPLELHAARKAEASLRSELARALPFGQELELEADIRLLLNSNGMIEAALFLASSPVLPPPEQWGTRPASMALATVVEATNSIAPGVLRALQLEVPAGTPTDQPYVRWIGSDLKKVQVVLPLRHKD